jgi:adenine-specific DNA-methyltransferase
MEWYLDKITSSTGAGANQWSKMYVEQLRIPEIKSDKIQQKFETIADYLIYLNDESKSSVNPDTSNASIASVFEDVLNMMVYELYFEQHMKEEEIDMLKFVDFESIEKVKSLKAKGEIINDAFKELQEQKNQIRNRIILSNIRSKNIIARINETTH